MNFNLTVISLSIFFVILFAILIIILLIRWRYPGKLIYMGEEVINLFDSIVKDINNLKISYNNKLIKENMYLIRGFLFNTGKKDISKEMIEKKINIKLPKGNIWHDARVISSSEDLSSNLEVLNNKIIFNLGQFRINEFIYFEAIAETSDKKLFNNKMNFEHRIVDIGKIKQFQIISISNILSTCLLCLIIICIVINVGFLDEFHARDFYLKEKILIEEKGKFVQCNNYKKDRNFDDSKIEFYKEKVVNEYNYLNYLILLIKSKSKLYSLNDKYKIEFHYRSYMENIATLICLIIFFILFSGSIFFSYIFILEVF